MRKWQQDLGGEPSTETVVAESVDRVTTAIVSENTSFTMTKFHWCAVVLIGTFLLLVLCKPILVQSQDKDRLYEAPRISYVTVITLSSLTAFGYLLSLGAD
jgi:hypothetical protein